MGLPWLWSRLHASGAGGTGLIPGQETKIPQAVGYSEKKHFLKKKCTDASETSCTKKQGSAQIK